MFSQIKKYQESVFTVPEGVSQFDITLCGRESCKRFPASLNRRLLTEKMHHRQSVSSQCVYSLPSQQ